MDLGELAEWRKKRVQDLVDLKFEGNKAALGRGMNYKDGAFIGHMIRGERPITEKTIEQFEALPGASGWFSHSAQDTDIDSPAQKIKPDKLDIHIRVGTVAEITKFAEMVLPLNATRREMLGGLLHRLATHPEDVEELAPEIAGLLRQPGKTSQPSSTSSHQKKRSNG